MVKSINHVKQEMHVIIRSGRYNWNSQAKYSKKYIYKVYLQELFTVSARVLRGDGFRRDAVRPTCAVL